MSPAQEADGLLAVQMLLAFFQVDVQILRRIIVLHIERHVIIHAADRIHDGCNAVKVDDNVFIRPEAHQTLDFLARLLDVAALAAGIHAVGCVDLLARAGCRVVAHGVARDVHDVDGLVLGIHGCDHQSVCSCFVLINCADHERKHIVNAGARVEQAAHIDLIAVFLVLDRRLRRTDEPHRCSCCTREQHQHNRHNDGNALALLSGCQLFFLLRSLSLFAARLGRRDRLVVPFRLGRCLLCGSLCRSAVSVAVFPVAASSE